MTTASFPTRGHRRLLAALAAGIVLAGGLLAGVTVVNLRLVRRNEAALAAAGRLSEQVARLHEENARYFIKAEDWLRALPMLAEAIRLGTGDPARDRANRIGFGMLVRRSPELSRIWMDGSRLIRVATDADGRRLLVVGEHVAEAIDLRRDATPPVRWNTAGLWEGGTLSSDGTRALLQLGEKRFQLVDTASGRVLFEGLGEFHNLPEAFSKSGRSFISWQGNTATVRSSDTGAVGLAPLELDTPVDWAVLAPWPKTALTKDVKGRLALWKVEGEQATPMPLKELDGRNNRLAGFALNEPAVLVFAERELFLYDATSATLRSKTEAKRLPQSFGQDWTGKWLYSGRRSSGLEVREVATGELQFFADHGALGFRGAFVTASPCLATQSWNGSARVWRIGRGDPLSPLLWQAATPGDCVLDPHGTWLATRGDEPAARLWRLRGNDGAATVDSTSTDPVATWFGGSPERLHVAERDGVVDAWSRTGATAAWAVHHPEPLIAAGPCAGSRLIFTCGRTRMQLWDAMSGAEAGPAFQPGQPIVLAAADPTVEQVAVVLEDGMVRIWSRQGEHTISSKARRLEFSPAGGELLVIENGGARVWDAVTGKPVSPIVAEPEGEAKAHFSPDGTRVVQWSAATRSGRSVARIWNARTGVIETELQPHWRATNEVVFSPDGRLTASGGDDHSLLICDARTGAAVRPPCTHRQQVERVGFSPDAAIVWSMDDDDITLWDTASAKPIGARLRHPGDVSAISWSPDSRLLVTVGKKMNARLWDCTPDPRPPEVLAAVARYLSAHTILPGTSDLRSITLEETRAAQAAAGLRK